MSDAKVKFYDDREQEVAADIAIRFGFHCPKGRGCCSGLIIAGRISGLKRDGQGQNGGRPMWDFDGNDTAPTFAPSINCNGCWHGYIENGRCVDCSKNDEPEP